MNGPPRDRVDRAMVPASILRRQWELATVDHSRMGAWGDRWNDPPCPLAEAYSAFHRVDPRTAQRDFAALRSQDQLPIRVADRLATFLGLHLELV